MQVASLKQYDQRQCNSATVQNASKPDKPGLDETQLERKKGLVYLFSPDDVGTMISPGSPLQFFRENGASIAAPAELIAEEENKGRMGGGHASRRV